MNTHEDTKLNVNINIKHQHLEQICVLQLTNISHKTKCWHSKMVQTHDIKYDIHGLIK